VETPILFAFSREMWYYIPVTENGNGYVRQPHNRTGFSMTVAECIAALPSDEGLSDLFIRANAPAQIRHRGNIAPLSPEIRFSAAEVDDFRRSVLSADEEDSYQQKGCADAAGAASADLRVRYNFFSTIDGPAIAIRPILHGGGQYLEQLGLDDQLRIAAEQKRGLVIITGATGSGKSTTLAAMVNHINRNFHRHILTIEDPVEFRHESLCSLINQRQIRQESFGFAEALRSALRENPDIIVIGEMRDAETCSAALNAALTGHLVLATCHTANAVQSVERIINCFPEYQREQAAQDLGLSLIGIFAQRLIHSADGSRMLPVQEILLGTPSVRKQVAQRDYAGLDEAIQRGAESGMTSFVRSAFRLLKAGTIGQDEAFSAVDNPDELKLLAEGMERSVDAFRPHYGDMQDPALGEIMDMRSLLQSAVQHGASDMILSVDSTPALRINGVLRHLTLPKLTSIDVQRLLFSVISARQRIQLEEERELDLALSVNLDTENAETASQNYRFRLNAFYQRGSLGVVARVVSNVIPQPDALGIPPQLLQAIDKQQGLILVTGPTGSGKSTTLASLIDQINRNCRRHIITIEDPIEYVHANLRSVVEQREVHADTRSFASALKYALREAPDVILVGEMRDVETMAAALTAAETGHLVLATVHTNSAPQTIDRIVDSFPQAHQNQIRQQLAAVLLAVVSQRLIPKLLGSGRVAAFEVLMGTPPVQALIREAKTFQLISTMETSWKDGMVTMARALEELYNGGIISAENKARLMRDYEEVHAFE